MTPLHIKLVAINARYTHSAPALFYLRHELESFLKSPQITLYQFSINEPYHETVLRLCAGDPEAIFLSAAIWNSSIVERLVKDIKICMPNCMVVVGGPQAERVQELVGDKASYVFGEIEGVDPIFYDDLQASSLESVYRGKFRAVREKGLAEIYRESDFDEYLQNRQIYYETSRGCPFSCSYCLSAAEVGVYHKPLDQVWKELDLILAHNPKSLRFIDRTFNDNWQRGLAIWKYLMTKDCDTLFHFEIAPDFFNEEVFEFLKTIPPGRMQFEIGIQSTNEVTLEAICRKMKTSRVHAIVSRLAAYDNIHLHVDLILGLPYENRETFLKSFEDVFAMGAHYIQMGLLKMLPDTPLHKQAFQFGYSASDSAPYSVYANSWLNQGQLAELYWFCECVEKFLNNRYFVTLWRYLGSLSEQVAPIFLQILEKSREHDLFERAATQELLTTILMSWAKERVDASLIKEILRYDWLRAGQKQIPKALSFDSEENFTETRDRLYHECAEEVAGVYAKRDRNRFFKRNLFWKPQAQFLAHLGYDDTVIGLCVSTEREVSLHRHQKIIPLRASL